MATGFPFVYGKDCKCEIFILSKHKRDIFPTSSSRKKYPLELVHTNICRQMQTQYTSGSIYFLTFIDDYRIKTWVYFLKNKTGSLSRFKDFKAEVEKKSAKPLKVPMLEK